MSKPVPKVLQTIQKISLIRVTQFFIPLQILRFKNHDPYYIDVYIYFYKFRSSMYQQRNFRRQNIERYSVQ